jgi:HlyD family secretion protein
VTAPGEDDPEKPRWFISSILANIAPGYLVQSGSSGFSAGTTIMTLSDLSHIFVLATVDESDIGQVIDPNRDPNHTQQKCKITVDAYPGVEFEGVVKRVATKGVNTSNVVTFEVKIEVTSDNRILLRPLMTATVKIISVERDNVLTIPTSAFEQADPTSMEDNTAAGNGASNTADSAASQPASRPAGRGGRGGRGAGGFSSPIAKDRGPIEGTVTVLDKSGAQETKNVTVGISGTDITGLGDYREVLSGLSEGDVVLSNKGGDESKWSGQKRTRGSRPFIPR